MCVLLLFLNYELYTSFISVKIVTFVYACAQFWDSVTGMPVNRMSSLRDKLHVNLSGCPNHITSEWQEILKDNHSNLLISLMWKYRPSESRRSAEVLQQQQFHGGTQQGTGWIFIAELSGHQVLHQTQIVQAVLATEELKRHSTHDFHYLITLDRDRQLPQFISTSILIHTIIQKTPVTRIVGGSNYFPLYRFTLWLNILQSGTRVNIALVNKLC